MQFTEGGRIRGQRGSAQSSSQNQDCPQAVGCSFTSRSVTNTTAEGVFSVSEKNGT